MFKIEQIKRSQCLKWNRKREKSVLKIEQKEKSVFKIEQKEREVSV